MAHGQASTAGLVGAARLPHALEALASALLPSWLAGVLGVEHLAQAATCSQGTLFEWARSGRARPQLL
jgi:hypothetical protein